MDEKLTKLKNQISKIDSLINFHEWGAEFQLWERKTETLVRELFGEDGLKLFNKQQTMTVSYINSAFNRQQYLKELTNRKKILNGLLDELKESIPINIDKVETETNILKEIWKKEAALKENLLVTEEAQAIQKSLITSLEKTLSDDSVPGLRFKKLLAGNKLQTWWSDSNGYPIDNSWNKIEPFLDILGQHEAGKTIKKRLEIEGLFVESRSQNEDQHLLIGKKDGSPEKAHIIIDGKNGDIRLEDDRQEPTELIARIETILTLHNGKKIKTTREAIEEV